MPQNQIFLPKKDILSFEEMIRLSGILTGLGIRKIRITGGEPFVRNDILDLMREIRHLPERPELFLTTNGVSTEKHLEALKTIGLGGINISLDALDPIVFERITHRNQFDAVWRTVKKALELEIPLKINAVVMSGQNTNQIIPLAKLAEEFPIEVRFIEEMPFNGTGIRTQHELWDFRKIRTEIERGLGKMNPLSPEENATATVFKTESMVGSIGIIAAFSRTFCGTCNRIRITATGWLKTCLYDNGVVNMRDVMRSGASDDDIRSVLISAFLSRAKDGFEAEKMRRDIPLHESMSLIGG